MQTVVAARTRRASQSGLASEDPADSVRATLRFDQLEIDERAREARVDGGGVRLTPREFALLLELARNPGVAFYRDRLLQKICGQSGSVFGDV